MLKGIQDRSKAMWNITKSMDLIFRKLAIAKQKKGFPILSTACCNVVNVICYKKKKKKKKEKKTDQVIFYTVICLIRYKKRPPSQQITCSKLTIETLEQILKYVQSWQ